MSLLFDEMPKHLWVTVKHYLMHEGISLSPLAQSWSFLQDAETFHKSILFETKPIMSWPCKTRMWNLNPVILYCVLEWRRNRNVVLNNHGKVWFFATYRSTNFFLDDNSLRFYTRAVSHNGFSGCYGFVLANILLPITCIE